MTAYTLLYHVSSRLRRERERLRAGAHAHRRETSAGGVGRERVSSDRRSVTVFIAQRECYAVTIPYKLWTRPAGAEPWRPVRRSSP